MENCATHFYPTFLKKESEAYEITSLSVYVSPSSNYWTNW
jgi:hypothetical protein